MYPTKDKKCRAPGCPNKFKPYRSTDIYCSPKCAFTGLKPKKPIIPKQSVETVFRKLRYKSHEPASRTRAKASARVRDGGICQLRWVVGDPSNHWKRIQVHHILYLSEGGPDELWNLITLCEDCHHNLAHRNKKWQPYLLELVNGRDCFISLSENEHMRESLRQKLRYFSSNYNDVIIKL